MIYNILLYYSDARISVYTVHNGEKIESHYIAPAAAAAAAADNITNSFKRLIIITHKRENGPSVPVGDVFSIIAVRNVYYVLPTDRRNRVVINPVGCHPQQHRRGSSSRHNA